MLRRLGLRLLASQLALAATVAVLLAAFPGTALAHDAPDDGAAAFVMADWMLLSFLVFASCALLVFVVALRRGLLSDLEKAKYYILEIDEPDYYTPEWAQEDSDATQR